MFRVLPLQNRSRPLTFYFSLVRCCSSRSVLIDGVRLLFLTLPYASIIGQRYSTYKNRIPIAVTEVTPYGLEDRLP